MRLLTLRSVLVATDLHEGSRPALRTAAELARLAGARLHLLHVSAGPMPDGAALVEAQYALVAPGGPAPGSVRALPGTPAAQLAGNESVARRGHQAQRDPARTDERGGFGGVFGGQPRTVVAHRDFDRGGVDDA